MDNIDNIESFIIKGLLENEKYYSEIHPYVDLSYFESDTIKNIVRTIFNHKDAYETTPTIQVVEYNLTSDESVAPNTKKEYKNILLSLDKLGNIDYDWLTEKTEAHFRERKTYNVISKAIEVYSGDDDSISSHAIPDLLREACTLQFEKKIGVDWQTDASDRHDYYTNPESKTPFDIDLLTQATNGGIPNKTLNVLLAPTNVGKTLALCWLSAMYYKMGLNVLYISMEEDEKAILKRVDANMLQVNINELETLKKDDYLARVNSISNRNKGKIKVVNFPPNSASASNIEHSINELNDVEKFKPDVVLVDYMGLMKSGSISISKNKTHEVLSYVAMELRSLAIRYEFILWTAVQTNRGGVNSQDLDVSDVAESYAIMTHCDYILGLMRNAELDEQGKILLKQVKTRYGNKIGITSFVLWIDIDKQIIYDDNNYSNNKDKSESTANKLKVISTKADVDRLKRLKT